MTTLTRPQAPAGRGKLVVADKVIEKIAGQAASEVATAAGTTGGFLGIGSHTDLNAKPKVHVDLYGTTATISVDLAVSYPMPIRSTTSRVRDHVIERVHTLTGVEVTRVDINVTGTHTSPHTGGDNDNTSGGLQ